MYSCYKIGFAFLAALLVLVQAQDNNVSGTSEGTVPTSEAYNNISVSSVTTVTTTTSNSASDSEAVSIPGQASSSNSDAITANITHSPDDTLSSEASTQATKLSIVMLSTTQSAVTSSEATESLTKTSGITINNGSSTVDSSFISPNLTTTADNTSEPSTASNISPNLTTTADNTSEPSTASNISPNLTTTADNTSEPSTASNVSPNLTTTADNTSEPSTTSSAGAGGANSTTSVVTSATSDRKTTSVIITNQTTSTTVITTTVKPACESSPCKNGGTCTDTDGGDYNCSCINGWTGKTCNEDINECMSSLNNCSSNEICKNYEGSFQCECKDTYYKSTAGECKKVAIKKLAVKFSDENWTKEYADTSSTGFKEKARDLEQKITEALNNTSTMIQKVKVLKLRQGSVIADTIVVAAANETPTVVSGANVTEIALEPTDLCTEAYADCDSTSTICMGHSGTPDYYECRCKDGYKHLPGVANVCTYVGVCDADRKCPSGKACLFGKCVNESCDSDVCSGNGVCKVTGTGEPSCQCDNDYTGKRCSIKVLQPSKYDDLQKILIAVGIGLGSLAFFSSLALIIVCCTSRKGSTAYLTERPNKKYSPDEVTIDSWMPSLPRPKIKPGIFPNNDVEMNEDGDRMQQRRIVGGSDNPAFIPEADYDEARAGGGKLAINGKKTDYVYF